MKRKPSIVVLLSILLPTTSSSRRRGEPLTPSKDAAKRHRYVAIVATFRGILR